MKSIKRNIVAAFLASTGMVLNVSADAVDLSANVAMTSNYVWRGMTQTANSPAIQGGFDASYKGVYAGVWASNIDLGTDASLEADIYGGYANEVSGLFYDLNYTQYTYPNETKTSNFGEASLTLAYDLEVLAVSAKYYLGVETDDFDAPDGWEAGISVPLLAQISLDATYGDYDKVGEYYAVSISRSFGKFDFTLAYTGMEYDVATAGYEGNGSEDNFVATLGTSF